VSDSRIRVSRSLYLHALADAIDWEESFLDSHEPQTGPDITQGHCGPAVGTERCEAYQYAHDLLKRYKRAYAKAVGHQPEPEPGRAVTLQELASRDADQMAAVTAAREE
jgi:hypothetical protein